MFPLHLSERWVHSVAVSGNLRSVIREQIRAQWRPVVREDLPWPPWCLYKYNFTFKLKHQSLFLYFLKRWVEGSDETLNNEYLLVWALSWANLKLLYYNAELVSSSCSTPLTIEKGPCVFSPADTWVSVSPHSQGQMWCAWRHLLDGCDMQSGSTLKSSHLNHAEGQAGGASDDLRVLLTLWTRHGQSTARGPHVARYAF